MTGFHWSFVKYHIHASRHFVNAEPTSGYEKFPIVREEARERLDRRVSRQEENG